MLVNFISNDLHLSASYLTELAKTSSHRYKQYAIPKRRGGQRLIHQPSAQIKLLQYWLVQNLFSYLPIHSAASAYMPSCSILKHALRHAENNFLLKIDFTDFFHSIHKSDIARILKANEGKLRGLIKTEEDIRLTCAIVCRHDCIVIGAPSSPILSNAVMFEFDEYWTQWSVANQVTYSRYADDLCFSTNKPGILANLLQLLRQDLNKRDSPKLFINDAKTVFTSRKKKRLVTGLVLTSRSQISLGRKKKREIRALLDRFRWNTLPKEKARYLSGYISFVRSVEPSFLTSLETKYGTELLSKVLHSK